MASKRDPRYCWLNYVFCVELESNLFLRSWISLFVLAFLVYAEIDDAAGQQARENRTVSGINQTPGVDVGTIRDFVDLLKAEAERSEKAVETMTDSMRAYADLLRLEAERSQQATKDEVDLIERTLQKFVLVVTAFGVAIGGVLTFLQIRTMRDIGRRAEREANIRIDELIMGAEKTVSQKIEAVEARADRQFTRLGEEVYSVTSRLARGEGSLSQFMGELEQPPADYHGKSVVWIDDQPDSITLAMRKQLEELGIKIEALKSTRELNKLLTTPPTGGHFDLIISDMHHDRNTRAGLDYFELIKGRDDLPPRLIFTSNSRLQALGSETEQEIQRLKRDDKRFLGAVTSSEPFFAIVYDALQP